MSHPAIDTEAAMSALHACGSGFRFPEGTSPEHLVELVVTAALWRAWQPCDAPVESLATADTRQPADDPTGLSEAQTAIVRECEAVREILLEKNRRYGNSALEPVRVFSRADSVEQIKVRLDDKLSRMASGQVDDDEDVTLDLIGYLILLRIAKRTTGRDS